MKKVIIVIIIIILLSVVAIGALGFVRAQKIKEQAKELQSITASTLNLNPIGRNEFEIKVDDWENYAKEAPSTKNKLTEVKYLSDGLKKDLDNFYSEQAQNKTAEAKYLQILIDGQRRVDLMNESTKKSKGQIESVLGDLSKFQNDLDQNNSSLDPKFDSHIIKIMAEQIAFKNYLLIKHDEMNYESPAVEIKTTTLNNTVEDFKKVLIVSLNDWVDLQNKIQDQILQMSQIGWVNPFVKY